MAIEFLSGHDPLVPDLTADDQKNNLVILDIIKGTKGMAASSAYQAAVTSRNVPPL